MTTTGAATLAVDGGTPVRDSLLPIGKGMTRIGAEERNAVLAVIESRSLFRYYGPDLQERTAAFERALESGLGTPHAVAVSSGTAALRTALAALGVGCGDEVVVPAFTFVATVNAVIVAGAVPVFAEVDNTFGLDPVSLGTCLSDKTAAIIPVHLENVACDMDAITAVAARAGVPVLEDAAQSMGATYKGKALGTIGDIGAFSLQLEKNVTAGEGGAVVTASDDLFTRAARYQDQGGQFFTSHGGGRGHELDEPFVGENLRMTEIAAAIAGVQLGKLPALLADLRRVKTNVLSEIGEVPGLQRRRRPDPEGDGSSSATWFAPDAETAARFPKALLAEGVPSAQMYGGRPVYATPAILERRTASNKGGPWHCAEHPARVVPSLGMCPQTEALVARSFTIGLGPDWSDSDCADAAEAVTKVAAALIGR